jgi:cysteine desulfurase/selenocysteine lyase
MASTLAHLGDRTLFPDLHASAYLNHSAVSPPSAPVQAAIMGLLSDYGRLGVSAIPIAVTQRERLRAKLASLLNAPPHTLALVNNTSAAALSIAFSFPWQRGDEVLLFNGEFPANVLPWLQAAKTFDLSPQWLPTEAMTHPDGLERVAQTLRSGRVRLIAISAVQFQTGWQMPLAPLISLAHAHGARVFVDAIQAAGCVPLDAPALGVDFLASSGHKWLMGVEGAGMLYISDAALPILQPTLTGWLSGEAAIDFLSQGPGLLRYDRTLRARADVFEGSSPPALGFAALEASVDLLLSLGVAPIFAHITQYLDALALGIQALDLPCTRRPGCESGILSIPISHPHTLTAMSATLSSAGVACSTPDGHLRFAPHWPNALSEVPFVLDALRDALSCAPEDPRRPAP